MCDIKEKLCDIALAYDAELKYPAESSDKKATYEIADDPVLTRRTVPTSCCRVTPSCYEGIVGCVTKELTAIAGTTMMNKVAVPMTGANVLEMDRRIYPVFPAM